MRQLFGILLCILALPIYSSQPNRLRILHFGDSHLTTRAGKSLGTELAKRTQIPIAYFPIGENGARASTLTSAIEKRNSKFHIPNTRSFQPHVVFLSFGTNEASGHISPRVVSVELSRCIDRVRSLYPGARIFIISPPFGKVPSLNSVLQGQLQSAKEQRILFINRSRVSSGISRDGVHFSETGYAQLNSLIADELVKFL